MLPGRRVLQRETSQSRTASRQLGAEARHRHIRQQRVHLQSYGWLLKFEISFYSTKKLIVIDMNVSIYP